MAWNRERLEHVAQTRLGGAKLIVVANHEPYIHRYENGEIEWFRPAGGLTTALDPVMRACGGIWVAHGSGDADQEVTDEFGRIGVPPDDPQYTLRRVWLNKREEENYYYGFSNSTLWPLCHQVYCRPTFEPKHWEDYKLVNQKFADAVLEEAEGGPALVFVQDYHFALLPQMLKQKRPDLVVAMFWHIPWPNPETFRVCPWANELLQGMLGNDLLSFHVQHHCNNFLETVDRSFESKIEYDRFAATLQGHTTLVRPHPISVDPELAEEYLGDDWRARENRLRKKLRLRNRPLLVGVDRIDYTKGIPERLRGVDRLLEKHPELLGEFHFLQVGAPSRTHLDSYRQLGDDVQLLVDQINWKYGSGDWQPIIFVDKTQSAKDVTLLYRIAAGCVVSSLHDGMNLVAKEFVASRMDEKGVLILSKFAGAAWELEDAIQINPFDVDQMSEGMFQALTMSDTEQQRRMRRMRRQVLDNNIYRWAGMLLSEVGKLVDTDVLDELDESIADSPFTSEFSPSMVSEEEWV